MPSNYLFCLGTLLLATPAAAWVSSHSSPRSASPLFISNIFDNSKSDQESLPRDVKEAVSKCRASTQEALKNRISRMDIEFPVGTRFGVEKQSKGKAASKDGPTQEDLQQSDRELARLFVDMFQPVGGDRIAVAFCDVNQANAAKKQWKTDFSASSQVLSMGRRKSQKPKKSKPKGFAAKLAAEVEDTGAGAAFQFPPRTEVALFVAPEPKELVAIEKDLRPSWNGNIGHLVECASVGYFQFWIHCR